MKEPTVASCVDFDPKKYEAFEIDRYKLIDGIRLDRKTKSKLEYYAKTENKRLVKPFVLVVRKDTTHAEEVRTYLESDDFFHGEYKDKVIEVHSNQTGTEKDENIEKLLNLERDSNTVEIVIHVNMLKEGWDVTNLYTIIPLRTAASTTLREQNIGRGLRLPYGEKTNNELVNRLTIVTHDKFEEIISAANEEGSIIKQKNIIDINEIEDLDKDKEVIENQSPVEEYISVKQIELENIEDVHQKKEAQKDLAIDKAISAAIDEIVHKPVQKARPTFTGFIPFHNSMQKNEKQPVVIRKTEYLNKEEVMEEVMEEVAQKVAKTMTASQISMFDETAEMLIEKVKLHYSPIVQQKIKPTIDIPDIAMIPKNEVTSQYKDFDLDMQEINFAPVSEDIMLESLKDNTVSNVKFESEQEQQEQPEQFIIGELVLKSKINYKTAKPILYKLIEQVRQHLSKK